MKKGSVDRRGDSINKRYRYTFRLNENENLKFHRMVGKANMEDNVSKFILGRIFNRPFKVHTIDRSSADIARKLDDFYYQFLRVGNNYNQIVKAVHQRFTDKTINYRLGQLIDCTKELAAIGREILKTSERYKEDDSENKIGK